MKRHRLRIGSQSASGEASIFHIRIAGRDVDLQYAQSEKAVFEHEFGEIFLRDCYGIESLPGDIRTVLDVGANLGLFSMAAIHRFPDAVIESYEPNGAIEKYPQTSLGNFGRQPKIQKEQPLAVRTAHKLQPMKIYRMLRPIFFALIGVLLFTQSAGAEPKAGSNPQLLLANVWTPSIDPSGWWISEKYDGVRGLWDGKNLRTRNGNPIFAPDYFLAELPAGVALDGELWMGRGKFEETSSTVLSDKPDERWKQVRFMIFDAPQAGGTFEERIKFIAAALPVKDGFVKPVAQERCKNAAHLIAERDRIVGLGGEGLMLRKPESAYEAGRSPTLLKVKPADDAEATVIGHSPGKGKYEGKTGSLRVRNGDGREFSIGAGLTDAHRATPPPIGTVITYRHRGVTAKGIPRFPSFLRVRSDAEK